MVRYKCSNRANPGALQWGHPKRSGTGAFCTGFADNSCRYFGGEEVCIMGFFEDRSKTAYNRAAHAVQNGTASREQREMNAKMAKTAGHAGNKARAAEQGRLKDERDSSRW